MKKYFAQFFVAVCLLLSGCEEKKDNALKIATCADNPPFEYYQNGEQLVGFDVELAEAIAEQLKKKAVFKDMAFGSIPAALDNGLVDAAVAAITISEEKKKNFDFSEEYCNSSISLIYKSDNRITDISKIGSSKVAIQLGCTGYIKLVSESAPQAEQILMDKVDAAVESLKAEQVKYVVADTMAAKEFCKKNPELVCSVIAKDGKYAILLPKGSPLKEAINRALGELKADGKIKELESKYLGKME
ncbi:MAG: ABC transporter substrate-binding protein [Holosporaceae bacterium]|nr:ABC transporter substrate-binding protein [Holosporaceae bacterium]